MHKTFLKLAEGAGAVHAFDTVEYRGAYWIVPTWKASEDGQYRTPARLIGLSSLSHRPFELGGSVSFYVDEPVPTSLLFGERLPHELRRCYDVLESTALPN